MSIITLNVYGLNTYFKADRSSATNPMPGSKWALKMVFKVGKENKINYRMTSYGGMAI